MERGVAVVKVKEEVDDGCERDGRKEFMRGSGIQRSFSNKVSAFPQFMSFKTVQEVTSKKTADPIGVYQKKLSPTEQGSANYAMAAYPSQHFNAIMAHHCNEIKEVTSGTQHKISVAMNNPFFKTHVTPFSHNLVPSDATVTVSHSIVPFAGSACPSLPKSTFSSPAQLTILYAGMVNVYDDVSPEKAHAIKFLAGDGSPANANIVNGAQALAPSLKQVSCDNKLISESSMVPNMQMDPQKITSLGSASAVTLIPSAVPQARRASLARFLEKRKERVMNRAPYDANRKSPENIMTPEPSMGDSVDGSLSGSKDES